MPLPRPQTLAALVLLTLGAGAMAASLAQSGSGGAAAWTNERAVEYQQAAGELHRLAFAPDSAESREKLALAQARYDTLRGELDAARSGGWSPADLLFWGGGALIVGAGLAAASGRERARTNEHAHRR
ncbi:hypothetical protein Pla175_51430 [Pirellulimonas nuda]|uniref:Uncharacterized protein n=1 Tax=Pirellulimonas nuda TaxID=2528009 RepID=A0A518DJR2_9BACT|nr:hypothetical protein [Pirellulimonas nuda]QDU91713.1 hypothetical protein Pla175_51430 [Pirellulimonas nuda]